MPVFLKICLSSSVILLVPVSCLLMAPLGCGTVLLIFLAKSLLGRLPRSGGVAALLRAASVCVLVGDSSGFGDVTGFRNLSNDTRKRIRLTKKTNVRKRFGVDLGEQPIPKRWKSGSLRDIRLLGSEGGIFCSRAGFFHVDEPIG